MDRVALINCDIYTGDGVFPTHALLLDGRHIRGIVARDEVPSEFEAVDLHGLNVAPGFIDLQVNGGGDVLFNTEPTVAGLTRIVDGHRKYGVTSLFPTYITGPLDGMRQASDAVAAYQAADGDGVLGLHFEGPLINAAKAGVHDKGYILDTPSAGLIDLLEPSRTKRVLLTLAPERVDPKLLEELRRRGIRIAAGHTEAGPDDVARAARGGLTLGTHVFNAMGSMSARDPGTVGALLADDRLWCSFIADGFHVDYRVLKVAISAKPAGKAFLVTDAMPPVGGEVRGYTLGPYSVTVTATGRCETADGVLAGSALDMASAVRNAMQKIGLPKDEALRMASSYPAEFAGVADRLGYIRDGYVADLVFFDNEIHVAGVAVSGHRQMFS